MFQGARRRPACRRPRTHDGLTDAQLINEALTALLARHHRSAGIDEAYEATYAARPLDEAVEWGDLESFRSAAAAPWPVFLGEARCGGANRPGSACRRVVAGCGDSRAGGALSGQLNLVDSPQVGLRSWSSVEGDESVRVSAYVPRPKLPHCLGTMWRDPARTGQGYG